MIAKKNTGQMTKTSQSKNSIHYASMHKMCALYIQFECQTTSNTLILDAFIDNITLLSKCSCVSAQGDKQMLKMTLININKCFSFLLIRIILPTIHFISIHFNDISEDELN